MNQVPNKEQVRMIFKDVYNFYLKYSNQDINWDQYHIELIELSHKYPFDLATKMLVELTQVLDNGKKVDNGTST